MPGFYFRNFTKHPEREHLAHYFPYDVKLRLLPHSRSFLANQKARNAIVGAANLLTFINHLAFRMKCALEGELYECPLNLKLIELSYWRSLISLKSK